MKNPLEAFNRMFIISLGEFTLFFKELNQCRNVAWLGKVITTGQPSLFLTFWVLEAPVSFNFTYDYIVRSEFSFVIY